TNNGDPDRIINSVAKGGPAASHYQIDVDNCSGVTLHTGDSCTVDVFFHPLTTGSKIAHLTVNSDDPIAPSLAGNMDGTGTNPAATGSIKIALDSVPNAGQDFGFSGDLGSFNLDDDSNATLPNNKTFSGLTAGSYTITQSASATRWILNDLSCSAP